MATQNPARTPAGHGINSGRFAASARSEDSTVALEPAPATRPLRFVLGEMRDGDSTTVPLAGGAEATIEYSERPAVGDNGQPVRGDVTGEYRLQAGSTVSFVHVGPHGTSGYGNERSKSYAAEQVEASVAALASRHRAKAAL